MLPNHLLNHRLIIGLIVVVSLIGIGLGYRYFTRPIDDGTLTQIQQRGSLRVGLDASFPPFETMTAEGTIVGIDVDIATAIADELGVTTEFVNIGFDGLYDALLARRVDMVISGLPYDPRWTQDVAYSHSYYNAGQMLVVRQNESAIQEVSDLAGQTIAIEWGSGADMEARRLAKLHENITISRQETAEAAISALLKGTADAAIVDAVTGTRAFPRGLTIITYLTHEPYVAAVHIDSHDLLTALNEAFTTLQDTGRLDEILVNWLHGDK